MPVTSIMQLLHAFFSARGNIVRIGSCTDDSIRISLTVAIRLIGAPVNRYTPNPRTLCPQRGARLAGASSGAQAPLSPSNWSALYRGCGSPVMSGILLKANKGQQASGVGDKSFFCFKRNAYHLWTAIIRHRLNNITHQQVMHFNQGSTFSNIFKSSLKTSPMLRDTRTAFSLPVEHARHDTADLR